MKRACSRSTASPNRPSSSRTPPSHSKRCMRVPRAGVWVMPYGGVAPLENGELARPAAVR